MIQRVNLFGTVAACAILLSGCSVFAKADSEKAVFIQKKGDAVTVKINGELFTEYRFKDAQRPYFYPVIGPNGENITRHWPMKEGANEEPDHPHHKSLWFTHGDVNGVDFWADGSSRGKIVHQEFVEITSGDKYGVIKDKNQWVDKDGKVICTDTRTHRFYPGENGQHMIDFDIQIKASAGPLTLGDTKEGSMAIRLTPTMRVEGKVAKGHIKTSAGNTDDNSWGKRAAWVDYYGPVKGEIVGVAIFDHPSNPKHPTWWHVRKYGLFAANPFGVSYFENKPRGTGDIKVGQGDVFRLQYRFYFHNGDTEAGAVADEYNKYARR